MAVNALIKYVRRQKSLEKGKKTLDIVTAADLEQLRKLKGAKTNHDVAAWLDSQLDRTP